MKSDKYQRRFYRGWFMQKDLYLTRVAVGQTDLVILTDKQVDKGSVRERVKLYRRDIENYIAKDRRFLTTLKPLEVELKAPKIIKVMAEAAKDADVGPMAAVAGAIAGFLGRDLLKQGYKDVIIENGGDIFLASAKTRNVGIYAGRRKLWNNLCVKIKSSQTPLGICASSGTIGHSLSFGLADAAVILSKNAALADAVATATANRVKSKADLEKAVDFASSVKGVSGVLIICGKNLATWGKIQLCNK